MKFPRVVFTTALFVVVGCDCSPYKGNSRLHSGFWRALIENAPYTFICYLVFCVMRRKRVVKFKSNAYEPDFSGDGLSKYCVIEATNRDAYQGRNKKGLL